MSDVSGDVVRRLEGLSDLFGLGHDLPRLGELEPQVAQVFASFERLAHVDVAGVEMAIVYARPMSRAPFPPVA